MIVRIPFWRPNSGATGPLYASNPWDTAFLGGRQMPGIVEECEPTVQWLVEKRKPAGRSGATHTTTGKDTAKFKIVVRIWTEEQWDAFLDFDDAIIPTRDKAQPFPYDLRHPRATLWSVQSIIAIAAEGPKITGGVGRVTYTVEQFKPPVKKSAVQTARWSFARDQRAQAPAAASTPIAPSLPASKYRQLNQAQVPSEDAEASAP